MKIPESERIAIQQVLAYAEAYGYGNLISHLVTAWAARLMRSGLSEKAAREAAGVSVSMGYPFQMQRDLVERGEWDETGKSYAVKRQQKPRVRTGDKRGRKTNR